MNRNREHRAAGSNSPAGGGLRSSISKLRVERIRAAYRNWRSALACAIALFTWLTLPAPAVPTPRVLVLHLADTIQPISEQYLDRGLARASALHADAILVEFDTPGGLLDSTRSMVHAILDSPTPVIVYVAPSGARAGSAGFFLLEAADIAAMAPGTNAGASHPVVEGRTLDPIMKQKLENDTTAFLRSYVSIRKRNVDAAQDAVLNSRSYTDSEALKLNLITLVSPDIPSLLNSIDGRTITRFSGASIEIHTRNAQLIELQPTTRERLLDWLVDPNIALLCAVLGALLIYLEFNTPGAIIPGALGTLLLLTSLFALNLLPVRFTSVMLLLAALALFLLEAHFPSHGVLAGTGIVCLVAGSLTLVAGPIPEQRIRLATAAGTGIGFGLITVFLLRIAWRARRAKSLDGSQPLTAPLIGQQALVGAIAIALEPFASKQSPEPEQDPKPRDSATHQPQLSRCQVLVHGELWFAQSTHPMIPGTHVRVTAVHGLTLSVEPLPEPLTDPLPNSIPASIPNSTIPSQPA